MDAETSHGVSEEFIPAQQCSLDMRHTFGSATADGLALAVDEQIMKPFATLSTLTLMVPLSAQNLVFNGDLELHTDCPATYSDWDGVPGWETYYTTSADYFNACATNPLVDVPNNLAGYQPAASGSAYLGVCTCIPGMDWYRELAGGELQEPLVVGMTVYVCFDLAVAQDGASGSAAQYSSNGTGVRFFTELPDDWSTALLASPPQVFQQELPIDTATWYHVSGAFVVDSAYRWFVVGNFFPYSELLVQEIDVNGSCGCAYALIDNVTVSYLPELCESVHHTSQGTMVGAHLLFDSESDLLYVKKGDRWDGNGTIRIFNASGGMLMDRVLSLNAERTGISLPSSATGVLLAILYDEDHSPVTTKFMRMNQ